MNFLSNDEIELVSLDFREEREREDTFTFVAKTFALIKLRTSELFSTTTTTTATEFFQLKVFTKKPYVSNGTNVNLEIIKTSKHFMSRTDVKFDIIRKKL